MTIELLIWLILSGIGVASLPFVGRRRLRESRFHRLIHGNGVRAEILRNRATRAGLLAVGVVMAAIVPVVTLFMELGEPRRLLSIVLLEGVLVTMVATLISDEWFSDRIDKAEQKKEQQKASEYEQ